MRSAPLNRKSTFTFKRKSRGFGQRRWQLKSISVNHTPRDTLAMEFWGQSYTGVIRVTKGGMTLVRGRKKHYLDWDKVAEALQNFIART